MADVDLKFDPDNFDADVALLNGDLTGGDDLATAVIISLFTWRRAKDDDTIPDGTTDRRGWWGDNLSDVQGDEIGSRLWLLTREKITSETVAHAEEYAAEALQWLVDDKVASRVDVLAARNGIDRIDMTVTIYRQDGTARELRFDDVWGIVSNG